ncbi:hypothetical protein I4U23_016286 [Adineta vaga]|nr:hypothetical protein I4U23_016286 [Adineta vaga]
MYFDDIHENSITIDSALIYFTYVSVLPPPLSMDMKKPYVLRIQSLHCHCKVEASGSTGLVTCIENLPRNKNFIDWSTFSFVEFRHYKFDFINFIRLTPDTFTNFTSTFSTLTDLNFIFTNGIDQIAENTFQSFRNDSDITISFTFNSLRNLQLVDYAFSNISYYTFTIDNIQYNNIHNLPYELNLKAFDKTFIVSL